MDAQVVCGSNNVTTSRVCVCVCACVWVGVGVWVGVCAGVWVNIEPQHISRLEWNDDKRMLHETGG